MIYITGDTHGAFDINKINPKENRQLQKLTGEDFLIICGDFGCVWDGAGNDRFWLNWLESLPWKTLFIDGNHDNFDLLKEFPTVDFQGGRAHQIRSNIFHLKRGEVYNLDGKKFFCFGGAPSHDVQYRKEHVSWWKDELPTQADVDNAVKNLDKVNWDVDYVVSHDVYEDHPSAKKYPLDLSVYGPGYLDIHKVLQGFEDKLNYKMWFTGHYHDDFKVIDEKGRPCITLFNFAEPIPGINIADFRTIVDHEDMNSKDSPV